MTRWPQAAALLAAVLLGALWPRLTRWPYRLSWRGLLVRALLDTLMQTWLRGLSARFRREKAMLAEQLGREPTDEEMAEYHGWEMS